MPKDPCSELSKVITQLALNIGSRPEVKNLDHVVSEMKKHIPEISRESLVASINEATTGHARAKTELQSKLSALKAEAKKDAGLRRAISELQANLTGGTLPEKTSRREAAPPSPAIDALTQKKDAVIDALRRSDPAIRAKFETQITNLTDRLEHGVFTRPESKAETPLSKDLQRLEYQRDQLKKTFRRQVQAAQPKTIWGHVAEPLNAARAVMTSMDLSAVFRQGGVLSLGNPVRAAKAIPKMLRAFASDEASFRINKEIAERDNAPLYAKFKLFLSDVGATGISRQEEAFVSRLAGKVPLVHASERAYVTFLNLLRADSFDAMSRTLGHAGEVTRAEGEAIANYINVATGRGKLAGSFEKAADAMNTVFFAPRLAVSRFQLLAGQPLYGGTAATRTLIAKEYAKTLAGAGIVLSLGLAAGGKVETDPRSSDFGKIRFGNTRLDPFAGLAQATTLLSRVATGKTKTAAGRVEPLRGPHAQQDTAGVIGRFLRGKLSPVAGAGMDLATGKNTVGEPVTPGEVAARLVVPMSFRDIYETMQDQGVEKGTALSILSVFGMNVNTYKPKRGG